MKTDTRIITGGFRFARESATVLATAKPLVAAADWFKVGDVTQIKVKKDQQVRKIYAPSPGKRKLKKKIRTQVELAFTATINDTSNFTYELQFGTSATTAAPAAGGVKKHLENLVVRGWTEITEYDEETDAVLAVHTFWSELDLESSDRGDNEVTYDIQSTLLEAALNEIDIK